MTYTFLRHFADSWGLVAMVVFFVAAVAFALRPGARDLYRDAAQIPLKNSPED